MRKALIATSALALAGGMAAAPASAADMLSVGVGGYMEQWIGAVNRDDDVDGGFDIQSDSEVYVSGSMESDMGLKFGVRVQYEANGAVTVDESNAWMSGGFGHIDIGARDPIYTRMHYAAAFGAGVGLNAGDTQNWIPGSYLETAGWTMSGDDLTLSYTTPRMNGVQVGASYTPDTTNENAPGGAPENNDDAGWSAAINFVETIGDMSVAVSLGHMNVSNSGSAMFDLDGDNEEMALTTAAMEADDLMMGLDDRTYTNAGLKIGMGAFTFTASYATRDDGGYMSKCYAMGAAGIDAIEAAPATSFDAAVKAVAAAEEGAAIDCGRSNAVFEGEMNLNEDGDAVVSAGTANAMHMFVEDDSTKHDSWAIGIGYADGPVSVSIGHMTREQDDGVERTATMVSAGYKLAPGVSWKTSIFGVEDTSKDGGEGTAFVTGLDIDF